jgi:hypothetical protein
MGFGSSVLAPALDPELIRAFADGSFQILHRRPLVRRQLGKVELEKSERRDLKPSVGPAPARRRDADFAASQAPAARASNAYNTHINRGTDRHSLRLARWLRRQDRPRARLDIYCPPLFAKATVCAKPRMFLTSTS